MFLNLNFKIIIMYNTIRFYILNFQIIIHESEYYRDVGISFYFKLIFLLTHFFHIQIYLIHSTYIAHILFGLSFYTCTYPDFLGINIIVCLNSWMDPLESDYVYTRFYCRSVHTTSKI